MVGLITDATGQSRSVVWAPDGSVRELPVAFAVVAAVSDVGAPVGYVELHAAVFDPETLTPTIVGPEDRSSVATDADGAFIAGWVDAPSGGFDVARFAHPPFGAGE